MWKDLTPRVFPLFSQCLPLYHCATLIQMIIGQNFWYLKLLFVIQTWQILVSAPLHLVLAAQGIRSPVLQQTEQNLAHNGLYNLKVSSPKNNVTNST
jgi:hypothetical protein